MSDTLQDKLQPMLEQYSEYSPDTQITDEGVASRAQLEQSIDFKELPTLGFKNLSGLVQNATLGDELVDQSRGAPLIGISHEREDVITPQSVATLASRVASETVHLRNCEINHEMRSSK